MNALHHWICRSSFWRSALQKRMLPWALEGVDLGDTVLEIGPGYGAATDVLRGRVARLAAVEIDERLARSLGARLRATNAAILRGDGAALPLAGASFTGAVCFTMLHHVPSPELQDRLFAEVRRVLKHGGTFAGTDYRRSRGIEWAHYRDTLVLVDPDTFGERLERAGFEDVRIDAAGRAFRFRAVAA